MTKNIKAKSEKVRWLQ